MPAAVRPPLRHIAKLARNTQTSLSPTRQPLPAAWTVVTDVLPCSYWEPDQAVEGRRAGLREGPNVVVVDLGPRMLVAPDADILVGDRILRVTHPSGRTVTDQPMRVHTVLWRETHQEVGLELLTASPVVEAS